MTVSLLPQEGASRSLARARSSRKERFGNSNSFQRSGDRAREKNSVFQSLLPLITRAFVGGIPADLPTVALTD
jgi:hypothetical protein